MLVTVIQLANDAKRIADESTIDTFKDGKTTIIYDTNGEQLCTMKALRLICQNILLPQLLFHSIHY